MLLWELNELICLKLSECVWYTGSSILEFASKENLENNFKCLRGWVKGESDY